jgi:hypothetical protein
MSGRHDRWSFRVFGRVQEDAQALAKLAESGTNIPLNEYVDRTSLDALCDSLSLDPEKWNVEDLERILLIRDGLYAARNKLRDSADSAAVHRPNEDSGNFDAKVLA